MQTTLTVIDENTPIDHVAALVPDALAAAGVNAVLSGGAVISICSENEFQSFDLDFITSHALRDITGALAGLGFTREVGRHFSHPRTQYLVEFPNGTVMVGDKAVHRVHELKTPVGTIRLLTPTDAVKDRLLAFFHWSDRQSLAQALAIAKHQPIDLADIEKWASKEASSAAERLKIFLSQLPSAK